MKSTNFKYQLVFNKLDLTLILLPARYSFAFNTFWSASAYFSFSSSANIFILSSMRSFPDLKSNLVKSFISYSFFFSWSLPPAFFDYVAYFELILFSISSNPINSSAILSNSLVCVFYFFVTIFSSFCQSSLLMSISMIYFLKYSHLTVPLSIS
jgi:hypothetical protein